MAMRQLIGTLSGAGSKLVSTSSMLQPVVDVSPMPMMPPQQTSMPAFCTAAMVSRRSWKGVRGDDLGVILGRGVDVVIVSGDAGFLELARFGRAELAERDADFHAELADFADGAEHLLELRVALAHAFPRRAHAEAGRAIRPRALRGGHDLRPSA